MRHLLLGFSAVIAVLPIAAEAQNYVRSRDYNGPGVVVNMDVIAANPMNGGPRLVSPPMNALAPAPVYSNDLPPPDKSLGKPLALKPPKREKLEEFSEAPAMPMPKRTLLASTASDSVVMKHNQPAMQQDDRDVPRPAPFSAEQLAATAPPVVKPAVKSVPAEVSATKPQGELRSINDLIKDADMGTKILPAAPAETKVAMLPPPAEPLAKAMPAPVMQKPLAEKPVAASDDFEAYRLLFSATSDELAPSEKAVLDKVIGKMQADPGLKLRMQAYAGGTPDNTAAARRMSLSRALKVRTYLTNAGIASTRLDIRALGMGSAAMGDKVTSGNAPADRVDMIFDRS